MGNKIKLFYPGLGVKRWLILFVLGGFIFVTGLILVIGPSNVWHTGNIILSFIYLVTGTSFMQGGILLILLGLVLAFWGGKNLTFSVLELFLPKDEGRVVDMLYTKKFLQRGPRVVVIGGGTGLSVLLRGLKEYTSNITAVVNVCDDGGSSGRLRGEMGILPPGDIRNCLLALADTEPAMEKLFQHRFSKGGELAGHNFGNLFIAAMSEIMGFQAAVREFSRVLAVRGQVLPVTLQEVNLTAELEDGRMITGQSAIAKSPAPIKEVYLTPLDGKPLPEALEAIEKADVIILGPGSLFTSIVPNLLVPGVVEAVAKNRGGKYYVCNVMTQPGETFGFTASQHLEVIEKYLGEGVLNYFIANENVDVSSELKDRYREEGAEPVLLDEKNISKKNIKVIKAPLISGGEVIRHDSKLLGIAIMESLLQEGYLLNGTRHLILQLLHQRQKRQSLFKKG